MKYIIMQVTAEMALKVLNSTTDKAVIHQYEPLLMDFNNGEIKHTYKTDIGYSIIEND